MIFLFLLVFISKPVFCINKILFDNGMPNEMRIPGYHNADMFFTIDRWMSEYIEMIGDLIGKNAP